jgi:hypothetical protein
METWASCSCLMKVYCWWVIKQWKSAKTYKKCVKTAKEWSTYALLSWVKGLYGMIDDVIMGER